MTGFKSSHENPEITFKIFILFKKRKLILPLYIKGHTVICKLYSAIT